MTIEIIIEKHGHKSDREFYVGALIELFHFFNNKIDTFMSQTTDLIAKLGEDIAGIAADVAGIGQEITDLKSRTDDPATVAALTDLEAKAAAAKAALDALVPEAPPAPAPSPEPTA